MTWGREPASDKQGKYLLSLFRQIGGRVREGMIDEATVRQFTWDHQHARDRARQGRRAAGRLQLCCLSPVDEKMIPSRFRLEDVDTMVKAAVAAANAALNVYVDARTVRADLRGNVRGTLADTELVFALVVDADHDKGKGGVIVAVRA